MKCYYILVIGFIRGILNAKGSKKNFRVVKCNSKWFGFLLYL